jgi:hypothetical protein
MGTLPHALPARQRKRLSLLGSLGLIAAITLLAAAVVAGAYIGFHDNIGGGVALAHESPSGQVHRIAAQAPFAVLVPSWLPQGMSLVGANGSSASGFYMVRIDCGASTPATPQLRYQLIETNDPHFAFGYGFADPNGINHAVPSVSRVVRLGSVQAELMEYTYTWQGQTVLHALALSWQRDGVQYIMSGEDVEPMAYQVGVTPQVQVLILPMKASPDDLIHMAESLKPAQ